MVVDSCGRLFIASAANSRVEIFGLPGHVDPEQFVPGRLTVNNQPVDPLNDARLVAYLEQPGYRLDDEPGDACPETLAGDPVGPDGCSVSQRCPCAGPQAGVEWANHGTYVSCVAEARREFVAAGILSRSEATAIVRQAARSACGRPR